MRKWLVSLAALSILISCFSCSVFDYLFKTKYQVLGEALVKSSGKGLEKQAAAASASASASASKSAIEKLIKATLTREAGTLENGLAYTVSDPDTAYTSVKKWNGTAFADAYKDDSTKYTEPPAKDDPNGPGLWEITMSITCTVTSTFTNYASAGWTFNGTITQNFAAEYVWELDIPGDPTGTATSTQIRANTDMTIDGTVSVSGKDTGSLTFNAMQFHIKEDAKGINRECTYTSGTAAFGATNVTDDLIDPIEEGVEKMKI